MQLKIIRAAGAAGLLLVCATVGLAQTSPSPGPTNPVPPNPQAKPGTIVINPTEEECRRGWEPGLKWTREQFEGFCASLKASK